MSPLNYCTGWRRGCSTWTSVLFNEAVRLLLRPMGHLMTRRALLRHWVTGTCLFPCSPPVWWYSSPLRQSAGATSLSRILSLDAGTRTSKYKRFSRGTEKTWPAINHQPKPPLYQCEFSHLGHLSSLKDASALRLSILLLEDIFLLHFSVPTTVRKISLLHLSLTAAASDSLRGTRRATSQYQTLCLSRSGRKISGGVSGTGPWTRPGPDTNVGGAGYQRWGSSRMEDSCRRSERRKNLFSNQTFSTHLFFSDALLFLPAPGCYTPPTLIGFVLMAITAIFTTGETGR